MKKILSLFLALVMVASMAAVAVSAEIMYEDEFEDEDFDWSFWGGIGKFVVEEGKMSGWEDAKIGQSRYNWLNGIAEVETTDEWPCQREFTEWIDVNVDEGGIGDAYSSGFWIQDGGNLKRGYSPSRTVYTVLYYAQDGPENGPYEYSFVQLASDDTMKDKRPDKPYGDHVYGRLYLPEYITYDDGEPVSGFNIDGDPVRLGVRFGRGNITAYANGKIVASRDYETIGTLYTPILVQNGNCYVEFDNYCLATYDHDVKKATRLTDEELYKNTYELYEGKVVIKDTEGNLISEIEAAEDDALTINAPSVSGKTFVRWDSVSVGGTKVTDAEYGRYNDKGNYIFKKLASDTDMSLVDEVFTDVERVELLYGIEIGELGTGAFEITMPDTDIELVAVYEDGAPGLFNVTVDGEVVASAAGGDEVPVNAPDAASGMGFDQWRVLGENLLPVDLDLTSPTLKFHMPSANVSLAATYVLMGDVDGDKNINARDVILVMRASLPGFTAPEGYIARAADMDNDKSINARDVIEVMKAALASATGGKN